MITQKLKNHNTYLPANTINDIGLLQVAFGIENSKKGANKVPTKVEMELLVWEYYMKNEGNSLLKKHNLK